MKLHYIVLLLCFCTPYCLPTSRIIQQILSSNKIQIQHSRTEQYENTAHLISRLHTQQKLTSAQRRKTINFLLFHKTIFDSACMQFSNTPGFQTLLNTLVKTIPYEHVVKGYFYELTTALACNHLNDPNYTVTAFGPMVHSYDNTIHRQFDVLTTKYIIECKNIHWRVLTAAYKNQFSEQKTIIDSLNKAYQEDMLYRVWSKNTVPSSIQQWMDTKGITCKQWNN